MKKMPAVQRVTVLLWDCRWQHNNCAVLSAACASCFLTSEFRNISHILNSPVYPMSAFEDGQELRISGAEKGMQ